MSQREVIDSLIRRKEAKRVGLMGSPWPDTLRAWVADGYPTRMVHKEVGEDRWHPEDVQQVTVEVAGEYEEPVPPWRHFGYDMTNVGPWFDIMPLIGFSEIVEETEEWEIRRNGAGGLHKYWKHKSGTPEHVGFHMTTREIWDRDYRPHVVEFDPERIKVPQLRRNFLEAHNAGRWTHFGHMFIWEHMRQSMGDVTLYESLILDPEWIHDFNRVYTDLYKQIFAYIFENVGKPDGIWIYEDLGYKNGLFASPKVLGELIFPYFAELVDFLHGYDLPVVLHSCGSIHQALPMIVDAGFDALNPMERKAEGNDPYAFAEQYGDKLAFIGGLDARVFETNDRAIIRREVAAYMEGMKARGAGLVFASDHSISTLVRYDTYRYVLDVYREHMMY